jgi:hypothetical protein
LIDHVLLAALHTGERRIMSTSSPATPPDGTEQLYNALRTGAQERADLNALRDGIVAYVRHRVAVGTPVAEAVTAVQNLVHEYNGRHGTHFAALAGQIVSWTIDEHYKGDGNKRALET